MNGAGKGGLIRMGIKMWKVNFGNNFADKTVVAKDFIEAEKIAREREGIDVVKEEITTKVELIAEEDD